MYYCYYTDDRLLHADILTALNSFIEYIPCSLMGINHSCLITQECIAVDNGHICVPSRFTLLPGETLPLTGKVFSWLLLGFISLI